MSVLVSRLAAMTAITAAVLIVSGRAAAPIHAQDDTTVSIVNNQYAPDTLTVAAGTTVTWVNNEDPNATNVTHDVESKFDTSWGSDYIDPGQSYQYTFMAPG